MLKDEIIEKVYSNYRIKKVPILFTVECINAIEDVLEALRKERPYATISDLFDE